MSESAKPRAAHREALTGRVAASWPQTRYYADVVGRRRTLVVALVAAVIVAVSAPLAFASSGRGSTGFVAPMRTIGAGGIGSGELGLYLGAGNVPIADELPCALQHGDSSSGGAGTALFSGQKSL